MSEGTPEAAPVTTAVPGMAARFFDLSFNQGDPTADAALASDFVFHLVDEPDRDAPTLAAFVADFRKAFPDLHVEIQTAFAQGDRVAARWTLRGTQEGPYRGIPATHKAVLGVPGHAILRVNEGKIAEVLTIVDTVALLQQLGVWGGSAGPAAAGPRSPMPGTQPDADTVAVVQQFCAAFASGDEATQVRLQRSWDRRNFEAWRAIFPDFWHTVEDVVVAGDLVIVRRVLIQTKWVSTVPYPRPARPQSSNLWIYGARQMASLSRLEVSGTTSTSCSSCRG